jgi:ABC-type transport system involved in multi-copper enzyme maturation permease subunit
MVMAIVGKEPRETRPFAALALGVYLLYMSKLTGTLSPLLTPLMRWVPGMNAEVAEVPFVQETFFTVHLFIGLVLAIALGFRQSAWEPSQGTAQFLLHLPLARRTIFVAKLSTGIGVLLACTLVPIVVYATWAATPGTHPGPFEWMMTGPSFRVWLILPLVYLGAFASGLRPARWFGSRLLPLVAVGVPATIAFSLPFWWLIGLPLSVLAGVVLVSEVLREAETRDF